MAKKLYCMFAFSKEGYMRGFASGYNKVQMEDVLFQEAELGHICLMADDSKMSKVPEKFISNYYWKMSQDDNDIKDIANLIL